MSLPERKGSVKIVVPSFGLNNSRWRGLRTISDTPLDSSSHGQENRPCFIQIAHFFFFSSTWPYGLRTRIDQLAFSSRVQRRFPFDHRSSGSRDMEGERAPREKKSVVRRAPSQRAAAGPDASRNERRCGGRLPQRAAAGSDASPNERWWRPDCSHRAAPGSPFGLNNSGRRDRTSVSEVPLDSSRYGEEDKWCFVQIAHFFSTSLIWPLQPAD